MNKLLKAGRKISILLATNQIHDSEFEQENQITRIYRDVSYFELNEKILIKNN